MKFIKMHGIGNDYVYVDAVDSQPPEDPAGLSRLVSRQHTGIGSDGLIIMERGEKAEFRMQIFNADGSEAQMCGNGVRCVGKYLYERGHTDKTDIAVETRGGIKLLALNIGGDGLVQSVRVDMGKPLLQPEALPVLAQGDKVIGLPILTSEGMFEFTCLSMGNPHAVAFVTQMPHLAVVGPQIEHHELFPERVNVHFAVVRARDKIEMRVWERGSGETQACGTGACAVLVAAVLNGLSDGSATISLLGGDLFIEWDRKADTVYMTGPATIAFEGEWINK